MQKQGYLIMLFILLFLYWFFARFMERIDLYNTLNQWWQTAVPIFSLPKPIIFVIEMLHPRVWRHLIAIIVGWFLAKAAAVSLIQTLYDLPDIEHARAFLNNLRSSKSPVGDPVKVKGETLEEDREKYVLLRVGGPGLVTIGEREVAVTELDGRFYRVLGPGSHKLELLEYIYAVLDLRQRERMVKDVPLMTKDGIEIKTSLTIAYRIDTEGELPTKSRPYPYGKNAAAQAAYAETILEDSTVSSWEAIPLNAAKAQLFQIIAKYKLDQILFPSISGIDPRITIKNELERRLHDELVNVGIELLRLDLGHFELEQQIINQYIEYWKAQWATQIQKEPDRTSFNDGCFWFQVTKKRDENFLPYVDEGIWLLVNTQVTGYDYSQDELVVVGKTVETNGGITLSQPDINRTFQRIYLARTQFQGEFTRDQFGKVALSSNLEQIPIIQDEIVGIVVGFRETPVTSGSF